MASVLVAVEPSVAARLAAVLKQAGHTALVASGLAAARRMFADNAVDAAFIQEFLPDGSGLELLRVAQGLALQPACIVVAQPVTPDGAEAAIRSGAWDVVDASGDQDLILPPLERALMHRQERRAMNVVPVFNRMGIVGENPRMHVCYEQMAKAAASEISVLVTGETGTGKELFARAIHANSSRSGREFVVVDCTALPASLAESILFGHARGAFTGADTARVGLVQLAHGGTLFLDEIGELPFDLQAKFLRVIQERRLRPVGASREVHSDFRLVAATNRNLQEMAEHGLFRTDLLFRLKAFSLHLPPLRERKDDIKELVQTYLARTGGRHQGGIKGVSPEFIQTLWRHDWPGNVRELFQVLENSLVSAHGEPTLQPHHLPLEVRAKAARGQGFPARPTPAPSAAEAMPMPQQQSWKEYRDKALAVVERLYFSDLIAACRGDMHMAGRLSGLQPARLYQLVKKHGLRRG